MRIHMTRCTTCGDIIPQERLDFFPDGIDYCVKCADIHTPVRVCRVIYPHKTGGELFVAEGKQNIDKLNREYRRAR